MTVMQVCDLHTFVLYTFIFTLWLNNLSLPQEGQQELIKERVMKDREQTNLLKEEKWQVERATEKA